MQNLQEAMVTFGAEWEPEGRAWKMKARQFRDTDVLVSGTRIVEQLAQVGDGRHRHVQPSLVWGVWHRTALNFRRLAAGSCHGVSTLSVPN